MPPIPAPIQEYINEIEAQGNIKIEIKDKSSHPNPQFKPGAFLEGNTIYIDSQITGDKYYEQLAHELTHIYFRVNNYPKLVPKIEFEVDEIEKNSFDKIISLVEDILIDVELEARNLPFDKYSYESELAKFEEIHNSGKFISVGSAADLPEKLKLLVTEFAFIRILIEPMPGAKKESLKNICIANLGESEWFKIDQISKGLKNIYSSSDPAKEKLRKALKFLVSKYGLKAKFKVE